jgi:2-hydroxychromene-2-carboxylate isomerase
LIVQASDSIDFWYSIGSTYSYLTIVRLDDVAKREGLSFRWRPFFVRPIKSDEISGALASATDQARQQNVFGVPTFVTRGEMFWGDDRRRAILFSGRFAPRVVCADAKVRLLLCSAIG